MDKVAFKRFNPRHPDPIQYKPPYTGHSYGVMSKRNRNKGDAKQVVFSPANDKDGYLARMAMEQAGMLQKEEDNNDVSSVDLDQQVEAIESGGNSIKPNIR